MPGNGYVDYYKDGFYKDAGGGYKDSYKDYYKDGFYKDASSEALPSRRGPQELLGPQSLRIEFERMGVADHEIDEIIGHLSKENAVDRAGGLGPEVKTWIQKMLKKSMDGDWQVNPATAVDRLIRLSHAFVARRK